VLGVYAQVVGGLLAVISAGIAQQAGESEGQQKLSGLMQVSQLPRRWPCWEGLLDTTFKISGGHWLCASDRQASLPIRWILMLGVPFNEDISPWSIVLASKDRAANNRKVGSLRLLGIRLVAIVLASHAISRCRQQFLQSLRTPKWQRRP
jgi:hypothetical protein